MLSLALARTLALVILAAAPASAQVVITQSKALAGNVTSGDAPGFPVTLTLAGSYRLGSDLKVPLDKNGIIVAAEPVAIDMNGFQILGGYNGIQSGYNDLTVRNGTIRGAKRAGITDDGGSGDWIIQDMRILENGADGINAGPLLKVRNSHIVGNHDQGIEADNGALIEGNIIAGNAHEGIDLINAAEGLVLGNTIMDNKRLGIRGKGGYGSNYISNNNNGAGQVSPAMIALQPNACSPACP